MSDIGNKMLMDRREQERREREVFGAPSNRVLGGQHVRGTRVPTTQRVLNLFTDANPQHTVANVISAIGLDAKTARRVLSAHARPKKNGIRKLVRVGEDTYRKLGVTGTMPALVGGPRFLSAPIGPERKLPTEVQGVTAPRVTPAPHEVTIQQQETVHQLQSARNTLKGEIDLLVSKFITDHKLFRSQVELSNDCSGVKVNIRL